MIRAKRIITDLIKDHLIPQVSSKDTVAAATISQNSKKNLGPSFAYISCFSSLIWSKNFSEGLF